VQASDIKGSIGFRIYGSDNNDAFGGHLTGADINCDGFDDIVVSAAGGAGWGNQGTPFTGEVVVMYGKANGWPDVYIEASDIRGSLGFSIVGMPGNQIGFGLAATDVNGDGCHDLVLGSFQGAIRNGTRTAGDVYVFFGSRDPSALPETHIEASNISGPVGFSILGSHTSGHNGFGRFVAAGDITGDGFGDVVVTAQIARGADNTLLDSGGVWIVFGGPNGSLPASYLESSAISGAVGFAVFSGDASEQLGYTVAVGDINGDGTQDLVMGAVFGRGLGNAIAQAGDVHVLFGGPRATLPQSYTLVQDIGNSTRGFTVYGSGSGDWCAWALAVGDINADRCCIN